ncbi:MAG: CapA family protein [Treponema sp.]|nr:CapA family protein [Treponema sp.]
MKNKIVILSLVILFLFSCQSRTSLKAIDSESDTENKTDISADIEIIEEGPKHHTLSFVAVGDNLFHDSLIRSSLVDGVYDFSPIYTEVKSIIENADLAFINQETVMAGTRFGYSGYPRFNTPQSLAGTLAETGFDIVNLANNHAMDMGRDGLYATLDFLDTFEEFTVIGARKEGENARIISKNDITLGFLSYTFSLNGIPLPRDNPNLVSMIDRNKMTQEINALRPLCDFLIVSIHWGAEYLLQPDRSQTDLAQFLAQHNVDLIIGHHPHVLQRVETITRPDGKNTICYYSLGNFVSHQRERERLIGGMMVVTFSKIESKDEETELSISDFGMIPVITHYDRSFRNTKAYPLYLYTEELLNNHGHRNTDRTMTMDFFYNVLNRLNTKIIMENPFIN